MTILNPKEWWDYYGVVGTCNVYVFNSATTDSLQLGSAFTGNLKIVVAGLAVTGLHPEIQTGLLDPWQDSTDLTNPIWNFAEITASALTYLVDQTFDGIVASYAKDDVWYEVNMGRPTIPVASFTYVTNQLEVTFLNQSYGSNPITDYYWTFGDTNTSILENPVHTYGSDGTYTVTLTVTDGQGLVSNPTSTEVTVSGSGGGGNNAKNAWVTDSSWRYL